MLHQYYTSMYTDWFFFSGFEIGSGQFTLVDNVELSFTVDGETRMCYNYKITNNQICEFGDLATIFGVQLGLLTPDNGIHIVQPQVAIIIDDSNEPECCECLIYKCTHCNKMVPHIVFFHSCEGILYSK